MFPPPPSFRLIQMVWPEAIERSIDVTSAALIEAIASVGAGRFEYEVQGVIGAGGMGEVYRATDTKLNRDVAIKVLRTTSAEEAARLEQEAKAAAALNHPHIVQCRTYAYYAYNSGREGAGSMLH